MEAKQQNLESEMLTASVAIESIIGFKKFEELFDDDNSTDNFKDSLELVQSFVKEAALDDSFKQRIEVFLERIISTSPTDKLRRLVDLDVIEQPLFKAWKKVRNSAAHGYYVKPGKFKKYANQCDKTGVLFTKLVFFLIDYKGYFTDYSEIGWPLCQFGKFEMGPAGAFEQKPSISPKTLSE